LCGISGIVNLDKKKIFPKGDLEYITSLVQHRGPDNSNIFISDNIGLGHTRLSIQDLSKKGNQPFSYLGQYIIVFNGEIYNFEEIKAVLLQKGYHFSTRTDTEVILASYDYWGENCVNKFNGMWAFSIFDQKNNKLFFSRDRFGIKPLYYLVNDILIVFGSEIKQLLKFSNREVNIERVYDYLILKKDEHLSQSFFKDIKKLPPGTNLVYDLESNTLEIKKYYDLKINKEIENLTFEQTIIEFDKLFQSAIKYRLISDVEIGSCLSGGLDSSSIVASALNYTSNRKRFKTFHAKSENHDPTDESSFVKILAENLDFESVIYELNSQDLIRYLEEGIRVQEEPFLGPSVILQSFVMQKAKQYKCKVLLDGQGGDETLLGYERYFSIFLTKVGLIKWIKYFFLLSYNSKLSIYRLLQFYFYFNFPSLRKKIILRRSNIFLKTKSLIKWKTKLKLKKIKTISDLQISEICQNQLPHLLRYEDKNSMASSIEARLPFLDFRLVEFLISVKPEYKLRRGWSKFLLRKLMDQKLPNEITWRKNKMGFELDQSGIINSIDSEFELLSGQSKILPQIFDRIILSEKYNSLSNQFKWRLYNLMKWEKLFDVKISKT